jgi:UDP-N-acetylglucosamine 2-epimerase (non-hydrolysing)
MAGCFVVWQSRCSHAVQAGRKERFLMNGIPAVQPPGRRPRVLLVFGTRPEAIKMAPVALALQSLASELETVICVTGQHREMLDAALEPFGLVPDIDLRLMRPRQTLSTLTARALTALDKTLTRVEPDIVVVQGDTTSAMVGALAGYYHRVPVAHLEAGLRTGDLFQPFPEEGNRRLISTLSALHFAPTEMAACNLQREGIPTRRVLVTGNTVIDALLYTHRHLPPGSFDLPPGARLVLLTLHRRESFGKPLESICRAVVDLVSRNPDLHIIFPVHASPFVREPVGRILGNHPRISLHDPMGYLEFIQALDGCHFVMTDSGGVQEEAPSLGKPVLVLRDKTERPEAVKAGTSVLVGTRSDRVLAEAERLLHNPEAYVAMAHAANPFGDGLAAQRVACAIRFHFGLTTEQPAPFDAEAVPLQLVGGVA